MPSTELTISVRSLVDDDIGQLESILRQHVRDLNTGEVVESEVQLICACMRGALDDVGRYRHYLVACTAAGSIVGCMAVSRPDFGMQNHFGPIAGESVELVNAFVSNDQFRCKGIGRMLFEAACAFGKASGAQYLLVNSGPRYRENWGFYDRVCDTDHGFIDNKYGEGRHAKTWRKALV